MMSKVGKTSPSYCTGLGKAAPTSFRDDPVGLLLECGPLPHYTAVTKCDPEDLKEEPAAIRTRKVSFDLEEHEPGVHCVASPIEDARGAVAAVSVAGPAHRLPDHLLGGKLSDAVRAAAEEISHKLGEGRDNTEAGIRIPELQASSLHLERFLSLKSLPMFRG